MLPNAEDVAAVVRALDEARVEVERLRAETADLREAYATSERLKAENGRWAEQVEARLREVVGHISDARLLLNTEPKDALKWLDRALAAAQPEKGK